MAFLSQYSCAKGPHKRLRRITIGSFKYEILIENNHDSYLIFVNHLVGALPQSIREVKPVGALTVVRFKTSNVWA
jgi:hypothetical protein